METDTGNNCFYNQITIAESKGFGPVQVAGKWKRCYDGFAARGRTPRQKYIARPETKGRPHKRHSAFHIGLNAYRWSLCWHCCQPQIQALLKLDRNKIEYHLRELRAVETVLATL